MQKFKNIFRYKITRAIVTALFIMVVVTTILGLLSVAATGSFWVIPKAIGCGIGFIILVVFIITIINLLGEWTKKGQ